VRWSHEGLYFFDVSLRDLAAKTDEFPRVPKIEPAIVENFGTQDEICSTAGGLRDSDLRAVNAAHQDLEKIPARKIV
jgi:hypothetical protein